MLKSKKRLLYQRFKTFGAHLINKFSFVLTNLISEKITKVGLLQIETPFVKTNLTFRQIN